MRLTWVNIGGTWKKVNSVWVRIGGTWKTKIIPKLNIQGTWRDTIQYIYNIYSNGIESVNLVRGYNLGNTNTFVKNENHILLNFPGSFSTLKRQFIDTEQKIDITEFQTINLEFQSTNNNVTVYLALTNDKGLDIATVTPLTSYSNKDSTRKTISLDISNYSGFYYLSFGIGSGSNSNVEYEFYKLYLE